MKTVHMFTASLLAAAAGVAHGQCDNRVLLAPDRMPFDHFGSQVSAKNGWVAIGAPEDDNARGNNAGSVYMWRKSGDNWVYYSRLQCPDNGPLGYGTSVATDGTTLAVLTTSGVYISERHADGFWYPAGTLPATPNTPIPGKAYGKTLAVNGDRIALGDWSYDYQGKTDVGAVHMYRKTGGSWQYHVTISNPTFDSTAGDYLGYSVAISDNGAVVVGAPGFDWQIPNATYTGNGAVYLFVPSGGSYALPQGGRATSGMGNDLNVGTSVAIDGNWIVAGVPNSWGYGANNAGTIAVFKREANNSLTSWAWDGAYPGVASEKIGTHVAISGNRVIASGNATGRAIEFQIPSGEGEFNLHPGRIIEGPQFGGDWFGTALAYAGQDLFIGNLGLADGANLYAGGVFLFQGSASLAADDYEHAPMLTLPAHVQGCTTMATSNSQNMGADICGQSKQTADVWYQFTAARSGLVDIDLTGDYDTVVSVHQQEPRGWDSFALACNDDRAPGIHDSRLQIAVTAGQTYHVRCSGYNLAEGSFTLDMGFNCPADFNGDGFLDFFDYDDFVTCFESGTCPAGKTADFNGDQFVDFFDYDDFVTAFEQGC